MTPLPLLLALKALSPSALPFDSIANPLLKAPSGTDIQLEGDLKNLQPGSVRVNQAGYRLGDVRAGRALFMVVSGASPATAVIKGPGHDRTTSLTSRSATISSQVKTYAAVSSMRSPNEPKPGYPKTGTTVAGTIYHGTLPTDLPPGTYTIQVGNDISQSFVISPKVYGMVRDASLMFFGVQRSGDGDSWFHLASHLWDGWLFDTTGTKVSKDAYKGALSGGWYDCGDHLKESRTQSFALAMLGVTAATMPDQDKDHFAFNHSAAGTDGIPDVLRELKWGADFALKAWKLAGGDLQFDKSKLYLSVGDFGADNSWWGRPEEQDTVTGTWARGGKAQRTLRKDWGTADLADWAAGLAFASKLWKPYDNTGWSDTALKVAKAFYELAKSVNRLDNSAAYNGEIKANDDLAVGAIGLLWATREKKYLNDLVYTPGMPGGNGGTCAATQISTFPDYSFAGGFMGCGSDVMRKSAANTDWASIQNPAIYSFFKLILKNADTAANYGISSSEHALLAERTINNLILNLSALGVGSSNAAQITLPKSTNIYNPTITADPLWYTMSTQQDWAWNKGHVGNLADLWMYYDMTGDIISSGTVLPDIKTPDWKRENVLNLLLRGANTLLGMNPWDISWVLGVGAKNPMHPHHRAANPEGRNMPSNKEYSFTIPIGALYGGKNPVSAGLFTDDWSTIANEPCLEGPAILAFLTTGLSQDTSTYQSAPTGTARTAAQPASLRVRPSGDRIVLSRTSGEAAHLEILDVRGQILSNHYWNGLELSIPRTRGLRLARLRGTNETLPLPPF